MDSNRILILAIVLICCSSGVVALVSSPDEVSETPIRLSFPEPLVKVKGYDVPEKKILLASAEEPVVEEAVVVVEEPVVKEVVQEEEKKIELGDLLPCSCCKKTIRVPKNPYTRHQEAARALPNSFFIRNDGDIRYGKSVNKLVEVQDGRGYRLDRLRHSQALLLPEVRDLLVEMGNDYADALEGTDSEGTVFRVTSLTRTEDQQKKLARRNRNATKRKSTHSYGASFDIAFMDRPNENANCSRPTREIQKLLLKYQKAGRILIIPEGGCMHITLIR
jgi:hypothetical protein